MKFLVCTLNFCCLSAISNKLLLAKRLEIIDLSDFISSKANICVKATESNDLGFRKNCSKQALEIKMLELF